MEDIIEKSLKMTKEDGENRDKAIEWIEGHGEDATGRFLDDCSSLLGQSFDSLMDNGESLASILSKLATASVNESSHSFYTNLMWELSS